MVLVIGCNHDYYAGLLNSPDYELVMERIGTESDETGQIPYSLPYSENQFDAIILYSILERSLDISRTIFESERVLKPEGQIFFTGIDRSFWTWITHLLIGEKIFRLIPYGFYDWQLFLTPREMSHVMEAYHFHPPQFEYFGFRFDFWSVIEGFPMYRWFLIEEGTGGGWYLGKTRKTSKIERTIVAG